MKELDSATLLKLGRLDAEQKRLTKQVGLIKDDVKSHMKENDISELTEGPVKAVFQIQERRTMNEDKLVEKLEGLGHHEAIKEVKKPDQSVIEELIYQGQLDPMELDDCIIRQYVEVLRLSGGNKIED